MTESTPADAPADDAVGVPTEQLPVAEVVVDTPLAHLDRTFEYTVPAELAATAVPGARVKVRFAGRDRDAYVVRRAAAAEHDGTLAPLRRVVSPEPVLGPDLLQTCRAVADHYAGTLPDVLRLAIPPRHATAEKAGTGASGTDQGDPWTLEPPAPDPGPWQDYPAGAALLRRLAEGGAPGAAWTALPDAGALEGWPFALATAAAATLSSGRGSVLVVPDHRDLDRLTAALDTVIGPDRYACLSADLGPAHRYREWLRISRGKVPVVAGVRSAAFAPVHRPGLFACWDDGDDLHAEPRAPYPQVRQVLAIRAEQHRAGLLIGGYTRSVTATDWVQAGRLQEVAAAPATVRERAPRVLVAGEGHEPERDPAAAGARLPTLVWRHLKEGLAHGPVLVQVPRRGYLPGLACAACRAPVRCGVCRGPMQVASPEAAAACGWCAAPDPGDACRACGHRARRSTVVGERRTAEELGRAFPGVSVVTSRAGQVAVSVPDRPALVIATPGAEPVPEQGYRTVALLDGWAMLDRAGLDSAVEATRRWTAAAALAVPASAGGTVVLAGVPAHASVAPIEALVRWAPVWLAESEWSDRRALGLPPIGRTAVLTGDADVLASVADELRELAGRAGDTVQVLQTTAPAGAAAGGAVTARCTGADDGELVTVLRALRARRSAQKAPGTLRIHLDTEHS